MVSPTRVTLLDWTQACLTHPEFDLGWMCIQHYSRLPVPLPEWLLALLLRLFARQVELDDVPGLVDRAD